jgi:hypothetical protein
MRSVFYRDNIDKRKAIDEGIVENADFVVTTKLCSIPAVT